MVEITVATVLAALKKANYPVATGDKAVNVVGIRATQPELEDKFGDYLGVLIETAGQVSLTLLKADTGLKLAPGHYPECWLLDAFEGQYFTLVKTTQDFDLGVCHVQPNPYTLVPYVLPEFAQTVASPAEVALLADTLMTLAESDLTFSYSLLLASDFPVATSVPITEPVPAPTPAVTEPETETQLDETL